MIHTAVKHEVGVNFYADFLFVVENSRIYQTFWQRAWEPSSVVVGTSYTSSKLASSVQITVAVLGTCNT